MNSNANNSGDTDTSATRLTPETPSGRSSKPASSAFATGGLGAMQHSVAVQDLLTDKLILSAPRVEIDGRKFPSLGGIPLFAKLGQGGMGAVYLGRHPRLDQEVAVKVLPFHLAETQPELVQRFIREARIAAHIRSPHLVFVQDVDEDSGLYFLVMEYVHGRSAGGYLRDLRDTGRGGAPESIALELCIAAAAGLAAAHAGGIIHRDIKPDNIIIPKVKNSDTYDYPAAKLADLGLARSEEMGQSMTGANACMGTPGYMSPEQATDARHCNKASDVFSLGATLYALLTGAAPFTGSGMMQILVATTNQPHAPIRTLRPEIGAATAEALDRCLAKDPAARFADAAQLREALLVCRSALALPEATRAPSGAPRTSTSTQATSTYIGGPSGSSTGEAKPLPSPAPVAPPAPAPIPAKSSMGAVVAVAVVAVLAGAAIAYWRLSKPETSPPRVAAVDAPKELSKPAETTKTGTGVSVEQTPPAPQLGPDVLPKPPKLPPFPNLPNLPKLGPLNAPEPKPAPPPPPAKIVNTDDGKDVENEVSAAAYKHAMENGRGAAERLDWKAAVSAYRNAVHLREGDAEARKALGAAYAALGLNFEEGKVIPKDTAEAMTCFQKGAELGDSDAQCGIGRLYMYGNGVAADYNAALDWFKKSADQGNSRAENAIGILYDNAWGVPQNKMDALSWWKKAAEHGELRAYFNLGHAYAEGKGILRDYAEALHWYRAGADKGQSACQNGLGWMHENGYGVPSSFEEAVKWYRKASDQGESVAEANLSRMLQYGRGVQQDYPEAIRLLKLAVEQGLPLAEHHLAHCYAYGEMLPRDDFEAIKWARKAAEKNYAPAETQLGQMYLNGRGTPVDTKAAQQWLRKAADAGDADGEYSLGWMYLNGSGVVKDYAEAEKWLKRASDQHLPIAENDYALMHLNGWGMQKNYAEALRLFTAAAEKKCGLAMYNIGIMHANGYGVAPNYGEAIKWYKQGAELQCPQAEYQLGVVNAQGLGVYTNQATAVDWFRKAAAHGWAPAQQELTRRGIKY